MRIEFDPANNLYNVQRPDLHFALLENFDFTTALLSQGTHKASPEARFLALGDVENRQHVLCLTPLADGLRVIRYRKTKLREVSACERQNPDRE